MKTVSFTFSFIIISTILFSCKKEVTELPAITQNGAHTFGCKIDGKFWVPAGFGIVPTAPTLEARIVGNSLYINARNFSSSPVETEFEIYIQELTGNGTYILNTAANYPSQAGNYGYYVHRQVTPDKEYITSSPYTGTVIISKIDSINRFVSGTFEFRAISLYDASQSINVTEGRFDVKLP
jgi:hypothetical protein